MKKISVPILYIKEGVTCTERSFLQTSTSCVRLSAFNAWAVKAFIKKLKNAGPSGCLLGTSDKHVIVQKYIGHVTGNLT